MTVDHRNGGSFSAYRMSLERKSGARLTEIVRRLGGGESILGPRTGTRPIVAEILERLEDAKEMRALLSRLGEGARTALGLFALTEGVDWPLSGTRFALECLGFNSGEAIGELLDDALVAEIGDAESGEPVDVSTDLVGLGTRRAEVRLVAHPNALSESKTITPSRKALEPFIRAEHLHQRETDGMEPLIRLAALWQRVLESPPRRSRQGTIYKRDRERFEDDPALAGSIADALEPLPDMAMLWLSLAGGVGLIKPDGESDRIIAADGEFWSENAIHLPQMIAARWLSLWTWHETHGFQEEARAGSVPPLLATPFLRTVSLLWLAALEPADWIALDDLAGILDMRRPGWDRLALIESGPIAGGGEGQALSRIDVLKGVLLGSAYQFGMVRAAEEPEGGGTLIQITEMGRYVLRLGPPPSPREGFEKFLYVQPNFEVIAYRQGLTPREIGRLARFARFARIGGALELKLTPESVHQGLEGGLTAEAVMEYLTRHGSKALATSVVEAIRTWSERRERITYHANAVLIEFASPEALEEALPAWQESTPDVPPPTRIHERMLLAADERSIPFGRFRQISARDYRREPEVCVTVEEDGVTLILDPERSDLFIDAELSRFTEELPLEKADASRPVPRRRFKATVDTIARGLIDGFSPRNLEQWFARRGGTYTPPAIELLVAAATRPKTVFLAERTVILTAADSNLLDGLLQHPETGPSLGPRLGPTAVVVPADGVAALKAVLESLGFEFESRFEGTMSARPSKVPSRSPEAT